MKFAKICWSLGSILVNVTIAIYIALQSKSPKVFADRLVYINENWAIYGTHWKAEFFIMTVMTIGALYFAIHLRKMEWVIITIGQFIILITYPLMIGGYENASLEVGLAVNQIATSTFVLGNVFFLGGMVYLYVGDTILNPTLRYVGIAIASIAFIVFIITYIGLITWQQAILVGPLVNVLYLLNAYYGYKLE
ncbi:hypothetical protein [Fulvivirga lutimaris]|uniref:hypothetical protein n=1 Tax=Fulvivirga lutimaris TaxID=1819566 RepID=UPI0012BB6F45|nr:hypothetical protein [Fulvivirga lutimaris]MTI38884.1 hypothetical protein [Fulvivirga lutimaris]